MKPFTFLSAVRKLNILRSSRSLPVAHSVPSPLELRQRLDAWEGLLQRQGMATLKAMERAFTKADRRGAAAACDTFLYLVETQAVRHAIRGFLDQSGSAPQIPTYLVSAWFLADCHRFLLNHAQGMNGSTSSPA